MMPTIDRLEEERGGAVSVVKVKRRRTASVPRPPASSPPDYVLMRRRRGSRASLPVMLRRRMSSVCLRDPQDPGRRCGCMKLDGKKVSRSASGTAVSGPPSPMHASAGAVLSSSRRSACRLTAAGAMDPENQDRIKVPGRCAWADELVCARRRRPRALEVARPNSHPRRSAYWVRWQESSWGSPSSISSKRTSRHRSTRSYDEQVGCSR